MDEKALESKEDILKRLRRIEGQVKGIQKMIEEEKGCAEILTQIAAARAALNKAGSVILEKHSLTCITNVAMSENKEQAVAELTQTLKSFMRFVD